MHHYVSLIEQGLSGLYHAVLRFDCIPALIKVMNAIELHVLSWLAVPFGSETKCALYLYKAFELHCLLP
jgi:hypothetical protein